MEDPEKEIRFIKDSIRLLKDDVETTLLSRGWAVTDLDVADEEPWSGSGHRQRRWATAEPGSGATLFQPI